MMRARFHKVLILGLMAGLPLAGCSKDHDLGGVTNPRDPAQGGARPPVPVDVVASVGDREIVLSWELPDSALAAQVRTYRIYRRLTDAEPYSLVDSSRVSPYRMRGLTNTSIVRVSVSSVLKTGLEGARSAEMLATPGVYAVTIEAGRAVTNDRSVRLTLEAPTGTKAVQLANRADFSDGATLPFSPTVTWTLPDGDGDKTVHARFLDIAGNPSTDLTDGIRLDTKAEIAAFDFSGSNVRVPGDIIVFTLDAGERSGSARVAIGQGGPTRTLYDDGTAPDVEAGDGIYTVAYQADAQHQISGAEVTGAFTDEAGNEAPERVAPRPLTIYAPPPALELHDAGSPGPTEIRLEWERAPEGVAFGSYRVYRSERPGVADDPGRSLVIQIGNRQETTHSDTEVALGRTYYYVVELVDAKGYATPSNEVSATPRPNDPPVAVVLDPPYAITAESVSLSWSRNQEPDFARYEIVRGKTADVLQDPERRVVHTISDAGTTSWTDQVEIEQGIEYHYAVVVVDDFGSSSGSNEVTAQTLDKYPTPVNLSVSDPAGETTIDLTWTESQERDFASYRLFRSTSPGVTEASTLLATYTESERIRHLDHGLVENTEYYYRIFVTDKGGNASGSNERKVTTANADPAAVNLSAPVEPTGQRTPTLDLAWTASQAHDFEAYRIYRDTSPAVGEGSTLVRSIDTKSTTTYRDAGLKDNTRYYYRVFVRDDAGASTGSEERSLVTANRAPTPVTLSASGSAANSISLSWTRNTDDDFAEYRLYRGFSAGSINTLLVTLTRAEQTTYTDLPGSDPGQDVFYKLVVVDRSIVDGTSLTADSNIVASRLNP